METREPLAILENMDAALVEYGNPETIAGEPSHGSAIFQPLVVGGRATGVLDIQNLDREYAGRIDFVYYYETGERRPEPPLRYGEGVTSQILVAREPLLLNRQDEYEGKGAVGTPFKSYLGVPIFAGDKAIGVLSVQSIRE